MSNEKIEWEESESPVGRDAIEKLETELGVKFPEDYVLVALKSHGEYPNLDTYDFEGRNEAAFDRLLSLDPEEEDYIKTVIDDIQDRLVPKIIPFAADPFGNYICFDYRKNNNPTVVFWDHEKAYENPDSGLLPICNTFSELEDKLYELED